MQTTTTICFLILFFSVLQSENHLDIKDIEIQKGHETRLDPTKENLTKTEAKGLENEVEEEEFEEKEKSKKIEIKIGVILPVDERPFSIQKCLPAILYALESRKVRELLPPDKVSLSIHSKNSKCNAIAAPLASFDLIDNYHVHVFFGPFCDYSLAPVAGFCPFWNVPIISPGGMAVDFRKNLNSQLLTQIGMNVGDLAMVMVRLLTRFNWKVLKVLYSSDGHSEGVKKFCQIAISAIEASLEKEGIRVSLHPIEQDEEDEDFESVLLNHIATDYQILMLCNSPDSIRQLMLVAHNLNFDNGEYVFINLDPFSGRHGLEFPWFRANDSDERNAQARIAYQSLLTVTLTQPKSHEYETFSKAVKKRANKLFDETVFQADDDVNVFVGLFHDTALLYAGALNRTLQAGVDPRDGAYVTQQIWNRTVKGITGEISINDKGDRAVDFSLLDMHPFSGQFREVGEYTGGSGVLKIRRRIHWGGHTPFEVPLIRCGFNNSLCPKSSLSESRLLLVLVPVLLLLLMCLAFFCWLRDSQAKKRRLRMDWVLRWDDIHFDTRKRHMQSSVLRSSNSSLMTADSMASSPTIHDLKIGYYKGDHVAIRKLKRPIDLTREVIDQMRVLKNLQGEHMLRFIGVCNDPPNSCVVTEYNHRRTLSDLLNNEQMNLDLMFKHSFIDDLSVGMAYLHNSDIRYHGNLNSHNCIVDSRFVLKITNVGLHVLQEVLHTDPPHLPPLQDHLYMAPEVLRSNKGFQKGDVYSFAIICQEVLARKGPFWILNCPYSVPEIIQRVKTGKAPLTRPTLSTNQEGGTLNQLISKCWAEIPSKRPDFNNIKWQLRRCLDADKPKGTNLLDSLLHRLGQYAQNLEVLVEEKTADYLEQRRRAEEILYRLLPRQVADELMVGGRVEAEKFEAVTVSFSDICGFTALSADSSPMQIVTMLNDLYTKFDAVIDTFNVYKVETIGDAYMVVSGLARQSRHASEIASMAMRLVEVVSEFKISHKAEQRLKLRTGVHSGPVCAGVVGRKMPRYCLFGDTVNTTISIQTMAEPMSVLVSERTVSLLEEGEFEVEERGAVHLVGKGELKTWILLSSKSHRIL